MDKDRRTFLKIILIGSGVLFIGKVLNPLFSRLMDDLSSEGESKSFQVIENEKILSIYDGSGEEIFQIDKES